MFMKLLVLLHCAFLVVGAPAKGFNFENPLSVTAGGPAFVALDNGVNSYFQTDGNFVIYGRGTVNTADALWYSSTGGQDCTHNNCQLIFQRDGNFVLYINGAAAWNTGTQGRGFNLFFENQKPYMFITDGNGYIIWSAAP